MCAIAGALDLAGRPIRELEHRLAVMSSLQVHRGPDGHGIWMHPDGHVGLAHRRLAVIDPGGGEQPMRDPVGRVLVFNGEIYNHRRLHSSSSDTAALLAAYARYGPSCVHELRGMFAFAVWDEPLRQLVLARDRLGIKPLYHATVDGVLYFASEAKALLPFLPSIETDPEALEEYLTFQFCLGEKTLFAGVRQLPPAHYMLASTNLPPVRYWDVAYDIDEDHTAEYFVRRIRDLLEESIDLHLRADVDIASYLSGGLDSSTITALANQLGDAFIGTFGDERYDETPYAREVADAHRLVLHEVPITREDFNRELERLIWHLDYPVAGPGAFPQYMVSRAVARAGYKVVLGGQGGDELFGGYARYLIAYFEQCLKAAIEGTTHAGNFVVTYESIIPNLETLRDYRPMLQEFWRDGLFDELDARYFRLIRRGEKPVSPALYERFRELFNGRQVGHQAYFDKMTHFDSKTLLPALLHVEDRVSMAHGLEARVPLLDHRLVELAATIPADIKFRDGELKHIFRRAVRPLLPALVAERRDKVGFAFPFNRWLPAGASVFGQFDRRTWGLVCLACWTDVFHNRAASYRALLEKGRSDESGDYGRGGVHRLAPR